MIKITLEHVYSQHAMQVRKEENYLPAPARSAMDLGIGLPGRRASSQNRSAGIPPVGCLLPHTMVALVATIITIRRRRSAACRCIVLSLTELELGRKMLQALIKPDWMCFGFTTSSRPVYIAFLT